MQYLEIPDFPRLRGEKAIEALYDFVDEVEGQKGKELTEKQTASLIKFAWGLISSIDAEKRLAVSDKENKEMGFVGQLKRTFIKYVPESFRNLENHCLWK